MTKAEPDLPEPRLSEGQFSAPSKSLLDRTLAPDRGIIFQDDTTDYPRVEREPFAIQN